MAAVTQLSPLATPGRRYSFTAKTENVTTAGSRTRIRFLPTTRIRAIPTTRIRSTP